MSRPVLQFLHKFYKVTVSPLLGDVCRFEPYCSDYAREAIERFGWFRGGYLTIKRLLKCHPYCTGGHDPVPTNWPGLWKDKEDGR